jgi:hypothetical protein
MCLETEADTTARVVTHRRVIGGSAAPAVILTAIGVQVAATAARAPADEDQVTAEDTATIRALTWTLHSFPWIDGLAAGGSTAVVSLARHARHLLYIRALPNEMMDGAGRGRVRRIESQHPTSLGMSCHVLIHFLAAPARRWVHRPIVYGLRAVLQLWHRRSLARAIKDGQVSLAVILYQLWLALLNVGSQVGTRYTSIQSVL